MSKLQGSAVQLGESSTASQNLTITANGDGTFTIARGNIGATTQDLLTIDAGGAIHPPKFPTASAPAYSIGAMYFDTTLNKLMIGGAAGWETITSS